MANVVDEKVTLYGRRAGRSMTGTVEVTMSELVSNRVERKKLQSLFTEYNRRYFGGRLPRYKVLLTNAVNPDGGRCERRKRRIYINPHKEDVSLLLLHEMVHAAVGRGHGKVFLKELRRLIELGAPLQEELKRYENAVSAMTPKQLLAEFFQAGLDAPDITWTAARRYLGDKWGLTDKRGRAKSRRWSSFLRRARREWSRGRELASA